MGISTLKKVTNNSNIIERKILNNLLDNSLSIHTLISESIENLGFNIKKEFFSEDILVTFVYLDVLKDHVIGKEKLYSNYHIILDHIEKIENILSNLDSNINLELLEFRTWLGVSDKFHTALTSI